MWKTLEESQIARSDEPDGRSLQMERNLCSSSSLGIHKTSKRRWIMEDGLFLSLKLKAPQSTQNVYLQGKESSKYHAEAIEWKQGVCARSSPCRLEKEACPKNDYDKCCKKQETRQTRNLTCCDGPICCWGSIKASWKVRSLASCILIEELKSQTKYKKTEA